MSTVSIILTVSLPILALAAAVYAGIRSMNKNHNAKRAFSKHLIVLAVSLCLVFSFAGMAYADTKSDATAATASTTETTETATVSTEKTSMAYGFRFIGAALSIGLAGIGAGVALAAGAPAAIGATAEDPKSFGKSLIFVALGEAVAIYGLIIAFLMIIPTL